MLLGTELLVLSEQLGRGFGRHPMSFEELALEGIGLELPSRAIACSRVRIFDCRSRTEPKGPTSLGPFASGARGLLDLLGGCTFDRCSRLALHPLFLNHSISRPFLIGTSQMRALSPPLVEGCRPAASPPFRVGGFLWSKRAIGRQVLRWKRASF